MSAAKAERSGCARGEVISLSDRIELVKLPPAIVVRLDRVTDESPHRLRGSITVELGAVLECDFSVRGGSFALNFALDAPPAGILHVPESEAARADAEVLDPAELFKGWKAISSNIERSADGRFEIEYDADGQHRTARDLWTGESVTGLREPGSAHQWCEVREEAVSLRWEGQGRHWRARVGGDRFIVTGDLEKWAAIDERFDGAPFRVSPDFATLDEAKRWCAIRATCVVEGVTGGPFALRYDPNKLIPF
jgi:hypothetical protein